MSETLYRRRMRPEFQDAVRGWAIARQKELRARIARVEGLRPPTVNESEAGILARMRELAGETNEIV